MSNSIDYDELDRAVTEAINNKKQKEVMKTEAQTITVRKTPAKPQQRGIYMDFVAPKRAQQAATPIAKPAAKPIARAATQPVARPVAQPATRPVATQRNVARTTNRPVVTTRPTAQTQRSISQAPVTKPATKSAASPAARTNQAQRPQVAAQSNVELQTNDAPNANNFSLGVRSPFIIDSKVDKRPLSSDIPENNYAALRNTKNVYSQKTPTEPKAEIKEHQVVETKKSSGLLWALIVLMVIAAGAGLGYLAYLIVFVS